MKKISLKHTIKILDMAVSYRDISKEVNNLKNKITAELKKEGVENDFEVVIEVENGLKGITFIPSTL